MPQVCGCPQQGTTLNIVTEYAEGGDLSSVIQKRAEQKKLYGEDEIMFMLIPPHAQSTADSYEVLCWMTAVDEE